MLPFNNENYEIIKQIGKGGMSTVYLAREKLLDRIVAIKLLHPALSADPKNKERLKREAQAIAKLNNDNIVKVFNYFEDNDASYIVMEFIDGTTLAEFILQNPVKYVEIALFLFLQIAKGIKYSHDLQIIHRDIKPENIMISKTGSIKITDFGIASILSEQKGLTTTGSVMGSPMFMSPEHINDEKIDHQSDIFSLGIILYNMLTNDLPFKGKNAGQILNNIFQCKYIHPQQINQAIPNNISKIIQKCLVSSKKERYQNVSEIIEDLTNYFNLLNLDPEKEKNLFFENPNNYTFEFEDKIVKIYVNLAEKYLKEKSKFKALHFAQLVHCYNPANSEAKAIIRKIERGNISYLVYILPVWVIALIVAIYFFAKNTSNSTDEKKINVNWNHKSFLNGFKAINKIKIPKFEIKVNNKKEIESIAMKDVVKNASNLDNIKKEDIKIINKVDKDENLNKNIIKISKIFALPIKITPKAASVYLNGEFYGYGNIQFVKIKTNQKNKLKITSKGCIDYEEELFYADPTAIPLTIRLKWDSAKLLIYNNAEGDVFLNNKYKTNGKYYEYVEKLQPTSDGKVTINLKVVKKDNIVFQEDIVLRAGDNIEKYINNN